MTQAATRPPEARPSLLTDFDLYLFNEGTHVRVYEKLGAHVRTVDGTPGVTFAVWAPNAEAVSVIGDFNNWDYHTTPLQPRGSSGIWESFVPGLSQGTCYKYSIKPRFSWQRVEKADPYGFSAEVRPKTASVVWDLSKYEWRDQEWIARRSQAQAIHS